MQSSGARLHAQWQLPMGMHAGRGPRYACIGMHAQLDAIPLLTTHKRSPAVVPQVELFVEKQELAVVGI